jgi:hypothetical protein
VSRQDLWWHRDTGCKNGTVRVKGDYGPSNASLQAFVSLKHLLGSQETLSKQPYFKKIALFWTTSSMWCSWGYRLQISRSNTNIHEIHNIFVIKWCWFWWRLTLIDASGRAYSKRAHHCLRPLENWNRAFESHSRHGCLSASILCVGSGLGKGWSPVQVILPIGDRITKPKKRPGPNKWL